jgi:hypothetical protein
VCLFTVHVGSGSSPLSCEVFLPPPLLQAFLLLITGQCDAPTSLHVCLQLTWEVGLPSSPVEFSSLATLTSFLSPGCWVRAPAPMGASPACLVCLFTVPGMIPFPQSLVLSAPHPLSCVSLLFLLLISQFSFFPGWRSVCPGGYAALAQGCLGEYCGTAKLTFSMSSQAIWVWATGGPGPSLFLHLS